MIPENTIIYRDVLEDGFNLHWYEIKSVLGRGSFGVTYLAWDKNLNQLVAIKEYFPRDFSSRDSGFTVHPSTGESRELYEWGLVRFIREAQTLAQFKHHNIVRVMSVFEMNNTAYMVMEYEEGEDLSKRYKQQKNLSEPALLAIFIPILQGLKLVHNAGFTHRDIKPANIYIRSDGSPVLIDFGSARKTTGAATRAITSLVTHGYAPFEQYNESDDKQGAWTDIYALGACLYCGINGCSPLNALTRGSNFISSGRDGYNPLSITKIDIYSENFLLAVDNALLFQAHERPQDVLVWADMLNGKSISPALPIDDEVTIVRKTPHDVPANQTINTNDTSPSENFHNINVNESSSVFKLTFKQVKKFVTVFIVIILISSAIAFYINGKDAEKIVNNTHKKQLIALLKSADSARRAGKLIETKNSAFYLYQKALKLDVKNTEASSRIRDILEHYNNVIKRDMLAGRYEKASINVELLLAIGMDVDDLNELKNDIKKARENKQKIGILLQQANSYLAEGKAKNAKHIIDSVLDIDPSSKAAQRLLTQIKFNDKKIKNKLKQAKRAFSLGNKVMPKNNNALSIYQDILKLNPENRAAKQGLIDIKEYFNDRFERNLNVENFASAKKIMLKVEKYLPEIDLTTHMKNAFNQKKNDSASNLEAVNNLINKFKKQLELNNLDELKKISQFNPNREQFLNQFFGNYAAFKVKALNIKYKSNEKKGVANIVLYDLVNMHGNTVKPGTWGRFKIFIRKNNGDIWKVYW